MRQDLAPPARRVIRDVELALDPVVGDILSLERPDDDLTGEFVVARRVIDSTEATLLVEPYET